MAKGIPSIKVPYLSLSDTLFSVCTMGGGNGNRDGLKCVFPFSYQGVTYSTSCAAVSVDESVRWCYTEESATEGSPWGYCHN